MSNSNKVPERPLITIALFAYNQEQYIRKAVDGTFAQSYSPLEVILSDDCSSDRTHEIMEQMAQEYRGPHTIILNRNEQNLGLIQHVNKVFTEIANGDVIVVAAGDDYSLPDRVVNTWQVFEDDSEISSVSMDYEHIDINGRQLNTKKNFLNGYFTLDDYIKKKSVPLLGCTRAYKKEIFEVFGNLEPWCGVEDSALVFRSLMLGKSYHMGSVGVDYRINPKSISKDINLRTIKGILKQRIKDSKKALQVGLIDENVYEEIKRTVKSFMYVHYLRSKYFHSGNSILCYMKYICFNREFLCKEKVELFKIGLKSKMKLFK